MQTAAEWKRKLRPDHTAAAATGAPAWRCWRAGLRGLAAVWHRVWASPWSLVGGVLAVALRMAGGQWAWRYGVLECWGGRLGAWLSSRGRWEAITLGHVVLAADAHCLQRWREHERVHVSQYERWGLFMVPAYLLEGAWQWARGRGAYADNRFERAARRVSDEA